MTVAYDAVADATHVLVPGQGDALALDVRDSIATVAGHLSPADAYACARVVSADQPAWLAAGLE